MPSPLGEGQTDMPINHHHLGEVKPTRRLITTIWVRSQHRLSFLRQTSASVRESVTESVDKLLPS